MSATDRIAELEARVARLLSEVAEFRRENAELRQENQGLKEKVAALEEKLRKTSHNSSKPPSSDGPGYKPKPRRKPTGRKPGGQPGHAKNERELFPPEKVTTRHVVKPSCCVGCGGRLTGTDPEPRRHQVFELPPVQPIVTEYALHRLKCRTCGVTTQAELPPEAPTKAFGPTVTAVLALLMGVYRLGKRPAQALMRDLFGLPISLGAIIDCQHMASAALEEPVKEAAGYVAAEATKHADETSWREGKEKAWLWVAVTQFVTIFMIHARRSEHAARKLLGGVHGVLVTDRHGAYNFWPTVYRQLCWAHLIRDFTAIAERGGDSKRIGDAVLVEAERMFAWWHRVRDGDLTRERFRIYMRSLSQRVEVLLELGSCIPYPKTARTCAKILKLKEALWTFVHTEGVEPTNNDAERAVRHGVIYRKVSLGTKSEAGSKFVERILTTHATLRQQKRNVLAFLTEACHAKLQGLKAPSLLPHRPTIAMRTAA